MKPGDVPANPVVMTSPSNVMGMGSISGQGTKIPHTMECSQKVGEKNWTEILSLPFLFLAPHSLWDLSSSSRGCTQASLSSEHRVPTGGPPGNSQEGNSDTGYNMDQS